jgi:hypothetical protein
MNRISATVVRQWAVDVSLSERAYAHTTARKTLNAQPWHPRQG